MQVYKVLKSLWHLYERGAGKSDNCTTIAPTPSIHALINSTNTRLSAQASTEICMENTTSSDLCGDVFGAYTTSNYSKISCK